MRSVVFVIFTLACAVSAWDDGDFEVFDVVEEVNQNFYELLGVNQDALPSEIKSAFKKLTLKLHPDKNDAPDADVQFRNLVSVHNILKDPGKREKYNEVLKNGLPNWRSAMYYYRHVRKMGLAEGSIILFIIITFGQYAVSWAAYAEKRFTAEQILNSRVKKTSKKSGFDAGLAEILEQLPRPSVRDTLPFQLPRAAWALLTALPRGIRELRRVRQEREEELRRQKKKEEEERSRATREAAAAAEAREARGVRKRRGFVPPARDGCLLDPAAEPDDPAPAAPAAPPPVLVGGLWTDDDLAELARLVRRLPGGTPERWERIAASMRRAVPEVTHMANKLRENAYRMPGTEPEPPPQEPPKKVSKQCNMERALTLAFDESDEDELLLPHSRRPRWIREREEHFDTLDDKDFITRFRLSKSTVMSVLESIKDKLKFRSEMNHCVSPMNQLLCALRYYATGCYQMTAADLSGFSTSSAHRIVHRVSAAIAALRPQHIYFPETPTEIRLTQSEFYQRAKFPFVVGAIDCSHVKFVKSPGGENPELFRNRKNYFSLNIQAICNANMEFTDIVARWPGSTHDSYIFNNCSRRAMFEQGKYGSAVLIGDAGYACNSYMMTPLEQSNTQAENLYNESHVRTRNCVERMFGVWKRRFPAMALGLGVSLENSFPIIVATAVLHNIARRSSEDTPPNDGQVVDPHTWDAILARGNISNLNADGIDRSRRINSNYRKRNEIVANYFARNLMKAEKDKLSEYLDLAHEVTTMRDVYSTTIVPIVVSVNGLLAKSLDQHLKRLSLDNWIKGRKQKAVIFDTARIVRRFLSLQP